MDFGYFAYNRNVTDSPFVSSVAALIGDPTRVLMLCALKEELDLSATESACLAGVAVLQEGQYKSDARRAPNCEGSASCVCGLRGFPVLE